MRFQSRLKKTATRNSSVTFEVHFFLSDLKHSIFHPICDVLSGLYRPHLAFPQQLVPETVWRTEVGHSSRRLLIRLHFRSGFNLTPTPHTASATLANLAPFTVRIVALGSTGIQNRNLFGCHQSQFASTPTQQRLFFGRNASILSQLPALIS